MRGKDELIGFIADMLGASIGHEDKRIFKRTKLVKNDKFMYLVPDGMSGLENEYKSTLYLIVMIVCINYLHKIPVKHYTGKKLVNVVPSLINYSESAVKRYLRKIGREKKHSSDVRSSRIVSENESASMTLISLEEDKSTKFLCLMSHSYDDVFEESIILINLDDDKILFDIHDTPFYIGNRQQIINKINKCDQLASNPVSYRDSMYMKRITLLEKLLETSIENKDSSLEEYTPYNDKEMYIVQLGIKSNISKETGFTIARYNVADESYYYNDDFISKNESHSYIDKIHEIPLIDFNEKEWKFVYKYWDKLEKIDILDAIENCKYGDRMRMKFNDVDIIFSCERYEMRTDYLKIYITQMINSKQSVVCLLDITNPTDFSLNGSVKDLEIIFFTKEENDIPRTLTDIERKSPLVAADVSSIIMAMISFLSVFKVIRDRPQRSRMVNYRKEKSHHHSKSKKKHNKMKESDFQITRILKPVKEARELVSLSEEAVERGERRKAEYVLEEWDRVGHTRTYKSGKTVYIEATHCHRHLPLTGKELHIKL